MSIRLWVGVNTLRAYLFKYILANYRFYRILYVCYFCMVLWAAARPLVLLLRGRSPLLSCNSGGPPWGLSLWADEVIKSAFAAFFCLAVALCSRWAYRDLKQKSLNRSSGELLPLESIVTQRLVSASLGRFRRIATMAGGLSQRLKRIQMNTVPGVAIKRLYVYLDDRILENHRFYGILYVCYLCIILWLAAGPLEPVLTGHSPTLCSTLFGMSPLIQEVLLSGIVAFVFLGCALFCRWRYRELKRSQKCLNGTSAESF